MAESWYYLQNDQQFGPVPREKVVQLLSSGELNREDLVWTDSMADWAPAKAVPGLVPAAPAARPAARPAATRPAAAQAAPTPVRMPAPAAEAYEEEPEYESAGLSPNAKIGIIAGCCGAGLLFLLVVVLVLSRGSGKKTASTEPNKTATSKPVVKERREITPDQQFRLIDFDPSSVKAEEKQHYDVGVKKGMEEVDAYVAGFGDKRPPDDQIAKKVKEMLKQRDEAVFVACRNGERDRQAMFAYGKREGVKAGIAKHNLPKG